MFLTYRFEGDPESLREPRAAGTVAYGLVYEICTKLGVTKDDIDVLDEAPPENQGEWIVIRVELSSEDQRARLNGLLSFHAPNRHLLVQVVSDGGLRTHPGDGAQVLISVDGEMVSATFDETSRSFRRTDNGRIVGEGRVEYWRPLE